MTSMLLLPFLLAADRPAVVPGQAGRSVTVAANGMVATSHPLAAQIGLDVLKKGGNAIDAAIATNAAMGLMEPTSNGIGGDLFAIVWNAKEKKLYGLNASGAAPKAHTIEEFQKRGLKEIPTKGPLSWSIPGCVDGWAALHGKFGSVAMSDLLAPTIRYAEDGHVVPEVIAGYWRSAQRADGSWFGRWGVNYVYGTWQAIEGLRAVGLTTEDPAVSCGADWLAGHQQSCGGWGETCESYADERLAGVGAPTPSQTAWAIVSKTSAATASSTWAPSGSDRLREESSSVIGSGRLRS
jgi:hypothetical protein